MPPIYTFEPPRGFGTSIITICVAIAITGCVSTPMAEVAMATEPQCDRPGVRLDSVKRAGSRKSQAIPDPTRPVSVKAGRYEIAVACQNPLNKSKDACTFWGHPNEYPTYKMPLKAGVRYTFHCYEEGADLIYNITESDL